MSSKLPALIDYLVALFTTAGANASPPFTVYDGPVITADPAKAVLWVGLSDPDSEAADTGATFTQQLAGLGQPRDETTSITCVAEAWSGADDLGTVRRQAFAIAAAAETAVRGDTTSFGGAGQAMPGVQAGELLQNTTEAGAVARVRFQVQIRSLNT